MVDGAGRESRGIGVVLVQLGTPDAPTARALRPFLREFLGDPRVLEMGSLARRLLLEAVILPFRPARSARMYRRIWTDAGSPLAVFSRSLAERLGAALGAEFHVLLGMRYGEPRLGAALDDLAARGCARVLIAPLFPQYASATTASIHDAVFAHFAKRRVWPALRFLAPFPEDGGYIDAVAARAREHLGDRLGSLRVIFSFHGVPERHADEGDPYPGHCERTAAAAARALGLRDRRWSIAYQSRFGSTVWLRPYLKEELERLAAEERGEVAVICPGFAADCLETIDEIGHEGARAFRAAGGKALHLVPCVNDSPRWVAALAALVRAECGAWS
ncbi:MAG: ferrochelatase [Planctomycetes bacterium]|nr:ferrochelatase [Planctomycetota bacterium]